MKGHRRINRSEPELPITTEKNVLAQIDTYPATENNR
jgi:hypothetical protein